MTEPASGERRSRNRERLYAAALELFAECGYEATSMDDVAVQAGMARRSAFNHFPAKSDITVEWAARRRDAALASVPGDGDDVLVRLRSWFRALGALSEASPAETEQMITGWLAARGPIRHRTGTVEVLREWLEAARRDGAVGPHVEAGAAAEILFDVYIGAICRWIRAGGALGDQLDDAVGVVLSGLAAPRR